MFFHWGKAMDLPEIEVRKRGAMRIMPPIFFSESISTVILKFVYMMGTSYTKLRLSFHKLSNINSLSPLLCEMLCAAHVLFSPKHWISL